MTTSTRLRRQINKPRLAHFLRVRPRDRLGRVVEELGKQSQARQEIEIKLGRHLIRAYELPTVVARADTTSFSVNHQQGDSLEENLLRYGYSKDFRPDLLQYRQLLATLDPMGMPLVSATLEGNGADDPLYFPTWQKMTQVIGHKKFVFIADCKAGSIATRAQIAANGGIYCFPVPMSGQHPQYLKQWVDFLSRYKFRSLLDLFQSGCWKFRQN